MRDRTERIVDAATAMFARYGFAKTTMADIAREAGMARQTVYNAFPGKEDILREVVRQTGAATLRDVEQVWREPATLSAKLEVFHQLGPISWFEAVRAAPDWAELIDGLHKAASEELATLDKLWTTAIVNMLRAELPAGNVTKVALAEVAEFFYSASLNAKFGAEDVQHLKRRLNTIRAATLALLSQE